MRSQYASAVLVLLISFSVQAANFDGRYITRVGDSNSDGRLDIYLQYRPELVLVDVGDIPVPIPLSRRMVGEFLLEQLSTGSFKIVPIAPHQRAQLLQLPQLPIKTIVGDFNADDNVDVLFVALHVNLDKTAERRRETFTA